MIPARDGHQIPARLYFPSTGQPEATKLPLYIYLHGGGYLFGSIETEDAHCRLISVQVPCIVLNVDYRHTPEWQFPTPFEDVFDAVDWITGSRRAKDFRIDLDNVVIGGVSAGATMALAVATKDVYGVRTPFVPSERSPISGRLAMIQSFVDKMTS